MATTENREVKSDVFSMLMEYKENALEVYNALNGSSIEDPELVEVLDFPQAVSLSIRNDASFIVDMSINLYEHQSTYNPNMPLRSLFYMAEHLKTYVKDNEYDIFTSTRVMIPTPRFVVFYNGDKTRPEFEVMKLSDSFLRPIEQPELEIICYVYNINSKNSPKLLGDCKVLREYTMFIEKIRTNIKEHVVGPIANAIEYCIAHNILKQFLKERRDEVLRIMTLDMTFETREKYIRRDALEEGKQIGLAEGIAQGIAEERLEAIRTAVAGGISKDVIINVLHYTEEEYQKAMKVE